MSSEEETPGRKLIVREAGRKATEPNADDLRLMKRNTKSNEEERSNNMDILE